MKENPMTMVATLAGRCAKDQGKFWEMPVLCCGQALNIVAVKIARLIGLNESVFNTCLTS